MRGDLTKGPITKTMLAFALPMILGNLLQQTYNVADTLIVGRFLGPDALAAVGSSYTLMSFLTSILLGLCMGSGAAFSIAFGEKNEEKLKNSMYVSFMLIGAVAIVLNVAVFIFLEPIMDLLQVPTEVYPMMREYLWIIFFGILATFLYNYFASFLRSLGNSVVPLAFLAVSAVLNIFLDLVFVLSVNMGVGGAALATVISQYISGIGIALYTYIKMPQFWFRKKYCSWSKKIAKEIAQFSFLTSLQQSVMNFGILMVQGLINSFGPVVMAAFAAGVKIDSFAYMPVQDFGNAFSVFVAQNHGAKKEERIRLGIRRAVVIAIAFCIVISVAVFVFASPLMTIFVSQAETEVIRIGAQYLRVEGTFYFGIGCLFLLYGFYRAVEKPGMSVVLTVISLGTRVVLAYMLSSIEAIGVMGIWWSVPIGWVLADLTGWMYYKLRYKKKMIGMKI
ncbi:MATE family efflux transporter [Lachnoclostridium sp. An181]|uniref:MATE family efflux transporter n=1 Tax=Lachnoclostridium sp. An181 TaxID=1965575 RepID=UPI000B39BD97|nr:MATE family efflux transporter [Lachnoclostridium sp. An181]OUP49039.1 MATE family efflux transporter [Lachnoclostridium sp. An181]